MSDGRTTTRAEALAAAIAAELDAACSSADPACHLIAGMTALIYAADAALFEAPSELAADHLVTAIVKAAPSLAAVHPTGELAARGFVAAAGPLASVVFGQPHEAVQRLVEVGTLDQLIDCVGLARSTLESSWRQARIAARDAEVIERAAAAAHQRPPTLSTRH